MQYYRTQLIDWAELIMLTKLGTKLTTRQRSNLADSDFALPGRRYPIHDVTHARLALAMVAKYGKPDDKAKVNAAVRRKYPDIGK